MTEISKSDLETIEKFFVQRDDMKKEKTIFKDLAGLPIEDNVRVYANEIFQQLGFVNPRKSPRKQIMFFCIYQAYKRLHVHKDPNELARMLNMTKKEINSAYRLCSESRTGIKIPIVQVKPSNLLPDFAKRVGLIGDYSDLMYLSDRITEKRPSLLEKIPQTVAVGILNYYCQTRGIDVSQSVLSSTFALSEVNIRDITNIIAEVDNS